MDFKVGLWIISERGGPHLKNKSLPVLESAGHVIPSKKDLNFFDLDKFAAVYGRAPTVGEIGCSLAHLRAYKHLAGSDFGALVVLEQDARLVGRSQDLLGIARRVNDRAGKPWIVVLDEPRIPTIRKRALCFAPDGVARIPIPYGTTSYIISREAAAIALMRRPFWQADWPPQIAGRVAFYAMRAPTYHHDRGRSLINRPTGKAVGASSAVRRTASLLRLRATPFNELIRILFAVHLREVVYSAFTVRKH